MEYIKLIASVVVTFMFFSIFINLQNGLIKRPWIIVSSSALFAVPVAYLFNKFVQPSLIYDFMLFLSIALSIKLIIMLKIAKRLMDINKFDFNEDSIDLVMYRFKKAKYISVANIVVFIAMFFVVNIYFLNKPA